MQVMKREKQKESAFIHYRIMMSIAACALMLTASCFPVQAQTSETSITRGVQPVDAYYIVASIANVRSERTASSDLLVRLKIGTQVEIVETRATWTKIRVLEYEGWLASSLLISKKPTMESLLHEYQKISRAQLRDRRKWAERVAAIAPDNPDAYFPLLETLKELGDEESLQQVQVAQAQALVKSTWLSLDPRTPPFQLGIRALYSGWLKANISYPQMLRLTGLPVFLQGPHDENQLDLNVAHDFGRYNPEFLKWLEQHLMPVLEHPSFVALAQPRYKIFLKHIGRTYYKAFRRFDRDQQFRKEQARLYEKENEARAIGASGNNVPFHKRYHLDPDQLGPDENARHRSEAFGFWLRRSLDGTFDQFGMLMIRLLKQFDPAILRDEQKSR